MKNEKALELRTKILKGIELAFDKLVISKQNSGGLFVFSKDDKIIFVKASEINK